jgi:CubicO group peptidase (beta-lactamase class C family)
MRFLRILPALLLAALHVLGQAPAAAPTAPSAPSAPASPFDLAAVDRLAASALERWGVPGLAIAIVDHDRVVVVKGYGVTTAGGKAPVGPDTRFQIGSTTKAFTTTLMAMLVGEGKMRWDDPVRAHLPAFRLSDPCADSLVTLRDLVSHRTGLAEHDELWDDSPWSRAEVIGRAGALPLARPFRSRYGYNNIMLMAAGDAAGAAGGAPWETLVKERIFSPLGMTSTGTSEADWLAAKDRAAGHKLGGDGRLVPQAPIPNEPLGPAGRIHTTARDLARWVRFQLGNGVFEGKRLVPEEALEETHTPQIVMRLEGGTKANNPETNLISYGMAWVVQDHRGELLVGHSGSLNGFRARVDLLPRRAVGFALLTNGGRAQGLVALRNGLIDLLQANPAPRDWNAYYLDLEAKAKTRSELRRREAEESRPKGTKPSLDLAAYAGTYRNASHGAMTVEVAGGGLVLRWNRLSGSLAHRVLDTFVWTVGEPDNLEETAQFSLDASGRVEGLRIFDVGLVRVAAPAKS